MTSYQTLIKGHQVFFTENAVYINDKPMFFAKMTKIEHHDGDNPYFTFIYEGKLKKFPYPKNEAEYIREFFETKAKKKPLKPKKEIVPETVKEKTKLSFKSIWGIILILIAWVISKLNLGESTLMLTLTSKLPVEISGDTIMCVIECLIIFCGIMDVISGDKKCKSLLSVILMAVGILLGLLIALKILIASEIIMWF